jgi:hypothetical protein
MSSRQAVVLASRVLCVFLVFWVVSNFIDLPADILARHEHWSALATSSNISYDRYFSRYYSLRLEALILKSALELFFAGVLYRCGPRISQFLTGGPAESDSAKVSPTA